MEGARNIILDMSYDDFDEEDVDSDSDYRPVCPEIDDEDNYVDVGKKQDTSVKTCMSRTPRCVVPCFEIYHSIDFITQ